MPERILKYFPEGLIELQAELATGFHPKLEPLLSKHRSDDWELKLAEICLYCRIVMDGTFDETEINALCKEVIQRLKIRRENPNGLIIVQNLDIH